MTRGPLQRRLGAARFPEGVAGDRARNSTIGLARLEADLRGQVLTGGSEDHDRSRRVFNAMIDRYPAVIVRCVDVKDVVHGIEFAHRHRLPVSVKGGGHSVSGSAVSDAGHSLDIVGMTRVVVPPGPTHRRGGTWTDTCQFDAATAAAAQGGTRRQTAQGGTGHGAGPRALSRREGFSTRTRKASESALAARRMVNGSQTRKGL